MRSKPAVYQPVLCILAVLTELCGHNADCSASLTLLLPPCRWSTR
jgi:hypothetical protein